MFGYTVIAKPERSRGCRKSEPEFIQGLAAVAAFAAAIELDSVFRDFVTSAPPQVPLPWWLSFSEKTCRPGERQTRSARRTKP